MIDNRQIYTLADFVRNYEEHVERLSRGHATEVLTIDGKPEIVLQSAVSYQALLDRLRELEDLAAIREGLAQADAGLTRPAEEFFRQLVEARKPWERVRRTFGT